MNKEATVTKKDLEDSLNSLTEVAEEKAPEAIRGSKTILSKCIGVDLGLIHPKVCVTVKVKW